MALGIAAPAAAAPTDAQRTAVAAAWEAARADWRVHLTCIALFPNAREFVEKTFQDFVVEASQVMAEAGYTPEEIAREANQSAVPMLRLPGDTPFGEVISFCAGQTDLERRLSRVETVYLHDEITAILSE